MDNHTDIVNKQCSTCHWWFDSTTEKAGMKLCVFHTGMKAAKNRKIDFGGTKPLRTTGDFGCNSWRQDERKNQTDV